MFFLKTYRIRFRHFTVGFTANFVNEEFASIAQGDISRFLLAFIEHPNHTQNRRMFDATVNRRNLASTKVTSDFVSSVRQTLHLLPFSNLRASTNALEPFAVCLTRQMSLLLPFDSHSNSHFLMHWKFACFLQISFPACCCSTENWLVCFQSPV